MATKPEPMALCLKLWTDWYQRDDRDAGYSNMRFLSTDNDFPEDEIIPLTRRENEIAIAVDVVVGCLARDEQWALRRSRGLCKTWIFPEQSYQGTLQVAHRHLEKILRGHIATSILFQ